MLSNFFRRGPSKDKQTSSTQQNATSNKNAKATPSSSSSPAQNGQQQQLCPQTPKDKKREAKNRQQKSEEKEPANKSSGGTLKVHQLLRPRASLLAFEAAEKSANSITTSTSNKKNCESRVTNNNIIIGVNNEVEDNKEQTGPAGKSTSVERLVATSANNTPFAAAASDEADNHRRTGDAVDAAADAAADDQTNNKRLKSGEKSAGCKKLIIPQEPASASAVKGTEVSSGKDDVGLRVISSSESVHQ
jgi:hypothetical protein